MKTTVLHHALHYGGRATRRAIRLCRNARARAVRSHVLTARPRLRPLTLHRLAHAAYHHRIPVVPAALQGVTFLLFKAVIPYQTQIGTGTRIAHGGVAVVLHPEAVIGRNVVIYTSVVIGDRPPEGAPTIEDNVYLGTGCKVLGHITVGEGSIIGANAVVTHSVPPHSVAVGVPARVIKTTRAIAERADVAQSEAPQRDVEG